VCSLFGGASSVNWQACLSRSYNIHSVFRPSCSRDVLLFVKFASE
jgi:hypothetical protein